MKTIKIFLASSEELKQERLEMADLTENLNNALERQGISIRLVKWEYLDASMGPRHKQEEYNEKLRECEMCLVLYWTMFGIYTKSEFDTAYRELCEGRNPKKLYVYFKESDEISPELKQFRDDFSTNYGHFYCTFVNIDTLKAQFLLQFMEYQSKYLANDKIVEVRDSKVMIDGKTYVELKNVPFAGNNKEYNDILEEIEELEEDLEGMDADSPQYAKKADKLLKLKEKRAALEHSLWDTALMITHLGTTRCSERLKRAMDLFTNGDNKGARAILNEEEIEHDVQHNLNLIKLGEEGRKGLVFNIEELRLKAKTISNEMADGWGDELCKLHGLIIELSETLYGKQSLEVASALTDAGYVFNILRKDQQMLDSNLRAYEIRKSLLGEQHRDTAESINRIGFAFYNFGKYDQALEYFLKAHKIRKNKLGEKHPETAESYNSVGKALCHLGDYSKALKYHKKALEIQEHILGNLHYETATSYNNIGDACNGLGNYDNALKYYLKALDISKKIHGSMHPDIANSYNNVGNAYSFLGNKEMALEYQKKALDIRKKIFGIQHPDTARSYNNVGNAYSFLSNYEKALEYQRKALEIRESVLGKNHPETAKSYNNVGNTYRFLGDYTKALKYLQKALEIREKKLGMKHPDTANTYNNIGIVYRCLCDYTQASEYYQKALEIRKKHMEYNTTTQQIH